MVTTTGRVGKGKDMATAEEIAGAILGEEPEAPEEAAPETVEETVETEEATTATETTTEAPETADEPAEEETKVPLKALQEERRKRQEYEARLKEVEEKIKPTAEPPTIESLYLQDPQGVTSRINLEIAKLQNDDPYGNAEAIERLRDLKIELRETGINHRRAAETQQVHEMQSFVNDIARAVPDFQNKVQVLTEFATNDLGLSDVAISQLSNPAIVGKEAAKDFIVHVAKQYEAKQAAATVKQKAVQPKPTTVEAPGTGSKPSAENLGNLFEEAKRTGNWDKYLDAKGVL